jgi:toxin HigB-1
VAWKIGNGTAILADGAHELICIPVCGITACDPLVWEQRTEDLFHDQRVREFQGIARPAKRKLEMLSAASRLDDLTIPLSNRLEKLRGNLREYHSIRINDQWRIIFKWRDGEPYEVRIIDYH